MQQQEQATSHNAKPPRLKIILLGSAGAGKTSILRRFVNGTFNEGNYNAAKNDRTRQRNTMSTLGADYYVKRMDNPLFGKEEAPNGCCHCRAAAQGVHITSRIKKVNYAQMYKEPHVLVQLWDTRGSEPSLPCYNRKRMQQFNMYQFLSLDDEKKQDDATIEQYSRYYFHRYNNWGMDAPNKWEGCIDISIPDRRISRMIQDGAMKRHSDGALQRRNSSSPKNALFDNVDACMLVYDATSSISFLRLMTFHEEWVKRFNDQEKQSRSGAKRKRRVPFIVVANKIDLLDGQIASGLKPCQRRDVMGLNTYRGVDEKYEYAANNTMTSSSLQCNCCCLNCSDSHCCEVQFNKSKDRQPNNKLTYSLKETYWCSDHQYLSYLQQADDQLAANRTMVLLWCKRNGIQHVEASALDGRGVDLAMEQLVQLGVKEKLNSDDFCADVNELCWDDDVFVANKSQSDVVHNDRYDGPRANENGSEVLNDSYLSGDSSLNTFFYQPSYEKELDLFARYSAKEDKKCAITCLGC